MTIREALKEGNSLLALSSLETAKIETPSLDAGLLLAEILGTNRTQLYIMEKDHISQENHRRFNKLLKRRLNGECIAYILGRKEFYGLDFLVNPAVLVPRPDTETLVDAALEIFKIKKKKEERKKIKVLDLCTGSGAVAIALKYERPELEVWASDISPEALAVARENAIKHQVHINFVKSDLFCAIQGRFDLIVSNPPYVASEEIITLAPEIQWEPRLALDGGENGLDIIRRIVEEAGNHLFPGGTLLMEADPKQMDTITGILKNRGFSQSRIFQDLSGKSRVIGGLIH